MWLWPIKKCILFSQELILYAKSNINNMNVRIHKTNNMKKNHEKHKLLYIKEINPYEKKYILNN